MVGVEGKKGQAGVSDPGFGGEAPRDNSQGTELRSRQRFAFERDFEVDAPAVFGATYAG